MITQMLGSFIHSYLPTNSKAERTPEEIMESDLRKSLFLKEEWMMSLSDDSFNQIILRIIMQIGLKIEQSIVSFHTSELTNLTNLMSEWVKDLVSDSIKED